MVLVHVRESAPSVPTPREPHVVQGLDNRDGIDAGDTPSRYLHARKQVFIIPWIWISCMSIVSNIRLGLCNIGFGLCRRLWWQWWPVGVIVSVGYGLCWRRRRITRRIRPGGPGVP